MKNIGKPFVNINFFLEMVPIIVFFVTYFLSKNLLMATAYIVGSTFIALLIRYILTRQISISLLFSSAVLLISGTVTLVTKDLKYVKMKPTIVFLSFGVVTYIGLLLKKYFVKDVFESTVKLEDKHWRVISRNISLFFILLAVINEVTWRFCSDMVWINIKVFGSGTLSALFLWSQLVFANKNKID